MSAPKVGDRVMVEFEATVSHVDRTTNMLAVRYEDVDSIYRVAGIPAEVCTVLAPPVKVGDKVTAENIGQLPINTVVALPPSGVAIRFNGGWISAGSTADLSDIWIVKFGKAEVLRIGGTS